MTTSTDLLTTGASLVRVYRRCSAEYWWIGLGELRIVVAMTGGERGVNSATARAPVEAEYSINDAPASVSGTPLPRPLSPPLALLVSRNWNERCLAA